MNRPIVGIDHVQVAAPERCEAEARGFYGGLLGLEEISKPPVLAARGGVWYRVGANELHIGVARDFIPATKAHPALRVASVAELERLAARLGEHGIDVRWGEATATPGATRFFVDDPWGNRVELLA